MDCIHCFGYWTVGIPCALIPPITFFSKNSSLNSQSGEYQLVTQIRIFLILVNFIYLCFLTNLVVCKFLFIFIILLYNGFLLSKV